MVGLHRSERERGFWWLAKPPFASSGAAGLAIQLRIQEARLGAPPGRFMRMAAEAEQAKRWPRGLPADPVNRLYADQVGAFTHGAEDQSGGNATVWIAIVPSRITKVSLPNSTSFVFQLTNTPSS